MLRQQLDLDNQGITGANLFRGNVYARGGGRPADLGESSRRRNVLPPPAPFFPRPMKGPSREANKKQYCQSPAGAGAPIIKVRRAGADERARDAEKKRAL